jgi:2-haloacid dehalogenase
MANQGITGVVFDIGGVLLDWDPRHLYRKLIADPADLDRFLGRVCTPGWHRAHDLGADIEQSCRQLAAAHPEHAALIMAWWSRGDEMVAGQLDDAVAVLHEVKSLGLACYALSNMEAEMYRRRLTTFGFFGLLDGCVISGLEGVAKPDKAIFEILLARYRLDPAATVFIDDSAANVMAAQRLGLRAIEYSTARSLREDLRRSGLPVGADGAGPHE